MIDSDEIGALGLDVHWQEPWDPNHAITNHPKSVPSFTQLTTHGFHSCTVCIHIDTNGALLHSETDCATGVAKQPC